MQKLPTEQQQQVLRFIEFLTFELGDRQVNQESANLKEGQPKSDFWKGLQKFRLTIQNEGVGLLMKILRICAIAVWVEKSSYELSIFA